MTSQQFWDLLDPLSLSDSRRLPDNTAATLVNPVMLLPGRARLSTSQYGNLEPDHLFDQREESVEFIISDVSALNLAQCSELPSQSLSHRVPVNKSASDQADLS